MTPDTAPTPERVRELLSVAEAATVAPWSVSGASIVTEQYCIAVIEDDGGYEAPERRQNAAHIAAFDPPTAISLCRDWQRLRAEVERLRGRQAKATSLLTEGVQIAKDSHRLEADLTAENATLSAALAEAKSLLDRFREAALGYGCGCLMSRTMLCENCTKRLVGLAAPAEEK